MDYKQQACDLLERCGIRLADVMQADLTPLAEVLRTNAARNCDVRDLASKAIDAYSRHPEALEYAMQRLARAVEEAQ